MKYITVKQLKEILANEDDDLVLIIDKSPTVLPYQFSPLSSIERIVYRPKNTWSGDSVDCITDLNGNYPEQIEATDIKALSFASIQ